MNDTPIDRNGYAPSIIQFDMGQCYRCHKRAEKLDRHEIFGAANRVKSKRLGLWVMLCHTTCHEGRDGVHQNSAEALKLHKIGQEAAMRRYGWSTEEFIGKFGKNYL